MRKLSILPFTLFLFVLSGSCLAQRHSQSIEVNGHNVNVTEWSKPTVEKPSASVLLLSGPTDNWNSDSAWFARLAPKLAKTYRVISIDRAGQVLQNPYAPLGYRQFGEDLANLLPQLNTGKTHVIAFASSNLALHALFAQKPPVAFESVLLIDPDVLLDYSIGRYKKDAYPFKENLTQYLAYISEGKYQQRALQKNTMELAHLKRLNGGDPDTDWAYLDDIFAKRLTKTSLLNTFKEIAIYDEDLDFAQQHPLPENIPLTVIDTNFEQLFIDKAEKAEEKSGLTRWQTEAKSYYQQLADRSVNGKYIPLVTDEHLLLFSEPEMIIELILDLHK